MGSHIASATAAADRLTRRDMPRFLKQIREARFSGVIAFALTTQNSDNPGLLNRSSEQSLCETPAAIAPEITHAWPAPVPGLCRCLKTSARRLA